MCIGFINIPVVYKWIVNNKKVNLNQKVRIGKNISGGSANKSCERNIK